MQGGGRIKIGEREIEFLYEISGRKYRREFFFVESSYRCKLEARLNTRGSYLISNHFYWKSYCLASSLSNNFSVLETDSNLRIFFFFFSNLVRS